MSIEDPLPARLSARVCRSATFFFALALCALPLLFPCAPAVAGARLDETALADLLADADGEAESRRGTEEAEFPGGSRIGDEDEDEADLIDVDTRLFAPFHKVPRADLDLENPFEEEASAAPPAPPRAAEGKRRSPAGIDLTAFPSRDLPPEVHAAPASVREVRPDRFPFRSALEPADPVDGLKRR